MATSAAHQRTRERFLALYEVTQASCATEVATRTHRHPQTVMEWLHLYNTHGPEALTSVMGKAVVKTVQAIPAILIGRIAARTSPCELSLDMGRRF